LRSDGSVPAPRHAPVIIIGSGPAGYTAAIYAARAMLKPLLIAGVQEGGQLTITTDVENYPGFAEPMHGPALMGEMRKQAERVGAEIVADVITEVDLDARPLRLRADSGTEYSSDALIIATGAQAKWLGVLGEREYRGFGVSACATCDGFFYRGKHVVVVGGGNTAVEEALYLSKLASTVTVIHRRNEFRAERVMQERLLRMPNVSVLWNTTVEEIRGTEARPPIPGSVTHLLTRNAVTGAAGKVGVDGVFVAIGHAPAVKLFAGKLKQKPSGSLWTEPFSTRTDVAGVFAAGDVTDDVYRQAVTAAGLGCMAALDAEKYLAARQHGSEA
jgi:thioredoxin reductase (NADPH)